VLCSYVGNWVLRIICIQKTFVERIQEKHAMGTKPHSTVAAPTLHFLSKLHKEKGRGARNAGHWSSSR